MNERPKKMINAEMTAEASTILKEWDTDLVGRTVHRPRASEKPTPPKTLKGACRLGRYECFDKTKGIVSSGERCYVEYSNFQYPS